MKILCVRHNDSDGLAAAMVVKHHHKDAEITEWAVDYSDQDLNLIPDAAIDYDIVYILDFSLPATEMASIVNNHKDKLIWIDHHKTAAEKLELYWADESLKGFRSLEKSGCELTWEYFYKDKKMPNFIKFVGDYDMWKFEHGETLAYHRGFSLNMRDLNDYDELLFRNGYNLEFLQMGGTINLFLKQKARQALKNLRKKNFGGYLAGIVNFTDDVNTMCEVILDEGYEIAIVYSDTETGTKYSLRSRGDIDVAKIAEQYGGGGHKNAAGFFIERGFFI